MPQELQGLLERINEEGFKKIEAEKASILDAAKAEAAKLVADAKAEAEQIVSTAKAEQAKLKQVGEDNVRQAARDLMLALESDVVAALNRLIATQVSEAMTPELLGKLLVEMVQGYAAKQGNASGVEVLLSADSKAKLETLLQGALAKELGTGATLVANPHTGAGLKVSFDGESVVHDLSADSIAEMLSTYMNAKIVAILRESNQG